MHTHMNRFLFHLTDYRSAIPTSKPQTFHTDVHHASLQDSYVQIQQRLSLSYVSQNTVPVNAADIIIIARYTDFGSRLVAGLCMPAIRMCRSIHARTDVKLCMCTCVQENISLLQVADTSDLTLWNPFKSLCCVNTLHQAAVHNGGRRSILQIQSCCPVCRRNKC